MEGGRQNCSPLIIGNQLYLRQKTNPVVALDLAKICNTSSSEKDCITYTEAGGENDLPSSIVGDSTHYYLDAAYGSGFSFEARNINDNTIAWTFTYASGFSEVNAPLTLYLGNCLYLLIMDMSTVWLPRLETYYGKPTFGPATNWIICVARGVLLIINGIANQTPLRGRY